MGKPDKSRQNKLLAVYTSCRDALTRSILKMSVKQEDVDDILQETYLRVLCAGERKQINSPQDYLFVVSRHLVIERLSSRSREITMEINDALSGFDDCPTDRTLHYKKKFEIFNNILRSLPDNKRHAILLRKFYGLSYSEIAGKMGVSISSVEKYIASGMKECRRKLSDQGYGFEDYTHDKENQYPKEHDNQGA